MTHKKSTAIKRFCSNTNCQFKIFEVLDFGVQSSRANCPQCHNRLIVTNAVINEMPHTPQPKVACSL